MFIKITPFAYNEIYEKKKKLKINDKFEPKILFYYNTSAKSSKNPESIRSQQKSSHCTSIYESTRNFFLTTIRDTRHEITIRSSMTRETRPPTGYTRKFSTRRRVGIPALARRTLTKGGWKTKSKPVSVDDGLDTTGIMSLRPRERPISASSLTSIPVNYRASITYTWFTCIVSYLVQVSGRVNSRQAAS